VQWGTVRMLGLFLTEELAEDVAVVPGCVVSFVAEQLGEDPAEFAGYGVRQQTVYEHAWEIRDVCGYREFGAGDDELRRFLAARVWSSVEGPRALFDRAVVWLTANRVLLPGITTLARLVAEVRREENNRLYSTLHEATPPELRVNMVRLLDVPGQGRVSELERLRQGPVRISGKAMESALDRASEIRGLGAGQVDAGQVPVTRMTGLARYGLASKAPALKHLEVTRQTATLLATVRHLETAAVDDALDLLDTLMASKLLARAERLGNDARLKALPQLRAAARKVARAVDVLMSTAPATEDGEAVSVLEAWRAIEKVVPRAQLADALAVIAAAVPEDDGDHDAEWRQELVARYGTVRGFIRLLVEVIDFGGAGPGPEVIAALRKLPALTGRKKVDASEVARDLVTGSWRRLVFEDPVNRAGAVDKAAYSFCVLEHLHRGLRRRDVFARGADRWGDPRARLLSGERWTAAQPNVLTALGLEAERRRTWRSWPRNCTRRMSRSPPGYRVTPRWRSTAAGCGWANSAKPPSLP
jgi:Domain of unknown function (DUF4158)